MATLVLSSLGTALGGPVGGAIGALVGRQADAALFGPGTREGPRLSELAATTSTYGDALPRIYGRMRVPGSVIWASDLVEHRELLGGGKGTPAVARYSYSASFAVALASRPVGDVGRIWADGRLLRGAAGDLKTGGTLRVHRGLGDEAVDPLLAEVLGAGLAPAFRDLAYVVFEDLDLADFYNRIPALTFEVLADDAFEPEDLLRDATDGTFALSGTTEAVDGMALYGPVSEVLDALAQVYPMDVDATGRLVSVRDDGPPVPTIVSQPAQAVADDAFTGSSGRQRRREPPPANPPDSLRYHDIDRDYQPAVQRAGTRGRSGQPVTIELPAALRAARARRLVECAARRLDWSRDALAWRSVDLDPSVAPGAVVALPDRAGLWRVTSWEWGESGVELSLERQAPGLPDLGEEGAGDPGAFAAPPDEAGSATLLEAFELPAGIGGATPDAPGLRAALSSASAAWAGAALYADPGDGVLVALATSGRQRSVMGQTLDAPAAVSPLLGDRTSRLRVELVDAGMTLAPASTRQLGRGANLALVGEELIQFGSAEPLGAGTWLLSGLLRGRGGTEAAVGAHEPGERFVLLDGTAIPLDPRASGTSPDRRIVAIGRWDASPVASAVALDGITLRPPAPVHPQLAAEPSGAIALGWTRRARGAWDWPDSVDTPLVEEREAYRVTFGPEGSVLFAWEVATAALALDASTVAALVAAAPDGEFAVRQLGTAAVSDALPLGRLP